MIKDAAYSYVRCQLWKRWFPPQADQDDLEQEYRCAELQGEDGRKAVGAILAKIDRITELVPSNVLAIIGYHEREPGVTDEEIEEARQAERAEKEKRHQSMMAKLDRALHELPTIVPEELPAVRMYFGMDGKSYGCKDIAKVLGKTRLQAEYLVSRAVQHLRSLATTKQVELPLFGESDEVHERIEVYRRRKHGPRQEKAIW